MVGRGKADPDRFSRAAVIVTSIAILLFCTTASDAVVAQKKKTGTVTGQVVIKGVGPMLGGTVLFFDKTVGPPPLPGNYWRVPTYAFKLDDNAQFKAELPPGPYYIGAVEKVSGDPLGPPQEGEYFFISQDRNGKPRTFTVKSNKTLPLGMTTAPEPFSRASLAGEGITALEGTVRDEKGEPVEGIYVFAFTDRSMTGKPLFVSDRTGKDGKYQLRLHGGGKYYLKARVNIFGPILTGELIGVYQKEKAIDVAAATTIQNIDITVHNTLQH